MANPSTDAPSVDALARVKAIGEQTRSKKERVAYKKHTANKSETTLKPDGYVTTADDPLIESHQLLSRLFDEDKQRRDRYYDAFKLKDTEAGTQIGKLKGEPLLNLIRAALIRTLHVDALLITHNDDRGFNSPTSSMVGPRTALASMLGSLLRRNLSFAEQDLLAMSYVARWTDDEGASYSLFPLHGLVKALENYVQDQTPSEELVCEMRALSDHFGVWHDKTVRKNAVKIAELVADRGDAVHITLQGGEAWSDAAIEQIAGMKSDEQRAWADLILHAATATTGKPSAKWKKTAAPLLKAVGDEAFKQRVISWFPLVDKPRTQRVETWSEWVPDPNQVLDDHNADVLKGLVWMCSAFEDKELARCLRALTISAYRKIPKLGPRAVKVGNACVWALGEMPGLDGIAQLALVKVRVRYTPAQKGIQKALEKTAERLGIGPDEVEEMSVPTYGMTDVGVRREQFGDFAAEVAVTGTSKAELRWFKPDGKQQKTMPKAVKESHADEVKALKQAAKDIAKMLPAQRDRVDRMFLQQRSWPLPQWRERYLEHPLVGYIARRLIWRFTRGKKTADAIWCDGRFVTVDDKPIAWLNDDKAGDDVTVALWHPIEQDPETITAWRDWLDRHEVRQPIKQAYREVYILTDAERNTGTYSNRYAAHIIKQHQFNALCAIRGWKNTLRLMVDDNFPPASRTLPEWNLRAEFWVEGAGDEYGRDTNETGTFLYLSTDQVRFYHVDAATNWAHAGGGGYESGAAGPGDQNINEPLPLTDIPALVFSEIMRDVDLFVGVGSVGNDPTWNDGGPDGRYRRYWNDYSFGDLSGTAETRKAVLRRIVPRLKIADRCSFSDRFLVVRGDVRTYKIHLGSGNILMEPNDQYLCIVQGQSVAEKSTKKVFLPFEGDRTLAIILSKALLLADDTKIKDKTILSQIKR